MNFIKLILAVLGLIFGVMLFFWLFGLITSLLWYGLCSAVLAAVGYGGYKLFRKAEERPLGDGAMGGHIDDREYDMSWDEYEQKYLSK